jgi:hypothetical protein
MTVLCPFQPIVSFFGCYGRSAVHSLSSCHRFKEPEGQMARWLQIICSFDMEIQYRAGRKHSNADGMSRVPCKQCQHCGTSEDTDSKHTIQTAVSQKSDITHSGDMSLVNAQQSDRNIQKMRHNAANYGRFWWQISCPVSNGENIWWSRQQLRAPF